MSTGTVTITREQAAAIDNILEFGDELDDEIAAVYVDITTNVLDARGNESNEWR